MNYKPVDFDVMSIADENNKFVKQHFGANLFVQKTKLSKFGWLEFISVRATYDFYQFEIQSSELKQNKLIKILKVPNAVDRAKREYFIKVMKVSGITETMAFKSLLELVDFPVLHLMNTAIEDLVDAIIDEVNPKRVAEFSKFISNRLYMDLKEKMTPEKIEAFNLSYKESSDDAYGFIEDQILKNVEYNSLNDFQLKIVYQYGLNLIGQNSEFISIDLGLDFQNKKECIGLNKKLNQALEQANKIVPDGPELRRYKGPKF